MSIFICLIRDDFYWTIFLYLKKYTFIFAKGAYWVDHVDLDEWVVIYVISQRQ